MATITDNSPTVQDLWWLLWYGLPQGLDRMLAGELAAGELPAYVGHLARAQWDGQQCDALTDEPAPFVPALEVPHG